MKFVDRQEVLDTVPTVFIGRRIYVHRRTGEERVAKHWYAEANYQGRTHTAALETESRSIAVHRAHEFAAHLRAGHAAAPQRQQLDIAELARQYLGLQVNKGRAPKTLAAYEYTLACFVAWAKQRHNGPAETFTEQLFWQWHGQMIADGYASKTRSNRLILVKQLFKWAFEKRKIPCNPLHDAKVKDGQSARQPCFDPAQVAAILGAVIEDVPAHALYATLAFAGLRFGEARALRWVNVVMPADRPGHLCIEEGGSNGAPKDGETRHVPLHPELRRILESLPRRGELVFYSPPSKRHPDGDRPLNQSTWLKHIKQTCRRCGFASPQQYKLHTFRHTFASMCARNNVAYKYALAWMGHSSSEILDLYYKQFDDVADAAIRTIDYSSSSRTRAKQVPNPTAEHGATAGDGNMNVTGDDSNGSNGSH